jgi:hypothetical protein
MPKFEQALRAAFERTAGEANVTLAMRIIRGEIDPRSIPAAERLEAQCYNRPSTHYLAMVALDSLLGTHGVEHIGEVDMCDGPPVEYLNTGDTYAATLVWYRDRVRPWSVESWGDVAERLERRGGK